MRFATASPTSLAPPGACAKRGQGAGIALGGCSVADLQGLNVPCGNKGDERGGKIQGLDQHIVRIEGAEGKDADTDLGEGMRERSQNTGLAESERALQAENRPTAFCADIRRNN